MCTIRRILWDLNDIIFVCVSIMPQTSPRLNGSSKPKAQNRDASPSKSGRSEAVAETMKVATLPQYQKPRVGDNSTKSRRSISIPPQYRKQKPSSSAKQPKSRTPSRSIPAKPHGSSKVLYKTPMGAGANVKTQK